VPPTSSTSASLLQRLRSTTDAAAWRRFVDLYTPLICSWARRLGLQEQDAADLVQDVFTLLVKKMPAFEYDRQRSFRAWLRTVLVNKWREQCRDRAPRGGGPAEVLDEVAGPDNVAAWCDEEFNRYISLRALQLMQADFQPATWKACWEHVVRGRDAAEVARELGLTVNAVYLATGRVLRRLREELDGMLD
jgi:RNA polymerase sigma-70 factor (ECF subfamily)